MPRHAVGPELTQLFVGSEGTLGVITSATLQLVPVPAARRFAAVAFTSVQSGTEAIRPRCSSATGRRSCGCTTRRRRG